jgi:hypothetical protein
MLRLYGHRSWLPGLAGRRPARSPTVVGGAPRASLSNRCSSSPARRLLTCPCQARRRFHLQARRPDGAAPSPFPPGVAGGPGDRVGEDHRTRASSSRLVTPGLLRRSGGGCPRPARTGQAPRQHRSTGTRALRPAVGQRQARPAVSHPRHPTPGIGQAKMLTPNRAICARRLAPHAQSAAAQSRQVTHARRVVVTLRYNSWLRSAREIRRSAVRPERGVVAM